MTDEKHKCPACGKQFDELYTVPSNIFEPFTAVDVMKGLNAWGAYQQEKTVLCHVGPYVHFAFLDNGEERLVKIEKLDLSTLAEMHEHHATHPQVCGEADCDAPGIPCYYNWTDEQPDAFYCSDHASKNGFCNMCGLFNAGFESFDFNPGGFCESCQDQLDAEFDDAHDDEEYDAEFDYDY